MDLFLILTKFTTKVYLNCYAAIPYNFQKLVKTVEK